MPNETNATCLRCGSPGVIEGEMHGHGLLSPRFVWGRRKFLGLFVNPPRLTVNYQSWACRRCGLVWSSFADLEKAQARLPDA
jgi:hypothetical protein